MPIERILIRGPNWVGDAVLAIPAMKAVRAQFPGARITVLVRPPVAGLFTSAPFIDSIWSAPGPKTIQDWTRLTREVNERRFDIGLLLPNSFESALLFFLGRVPLRIGYGTDARGWMLTHPVVPGDDGRHQVYYYLDLVQRQTLPKDPDLPSIDIQATNEERTDARRLLEGCGIGADARFLVLNPGAAYGSAKRWYPERFASAADILAKEFGFAVAIVGSQSERPIAEQIGNTMKTRSTVLSGQTSLETLIGVLAESSLMLTNDSGPMHIAAALGTPTVAVFGPTDERVTSPCGSQTRVVKHPVECSPCLLRECPIDHRCMERAGVEDVCRAARELLAYA